MTDAQLVIRTELQLGCDLWRSRHVHNNDFILVDNRDSRIVPHSASLMLKYLISQISLQTQILLLILRLQHLIEPIGAYPIYIDLLLVQKQALLHAQWLKSGLFDDLFGARLPEQSLHGG